MARKPNPARIDGEDPAPVQVAWKPYPGPQTAALRRVEDEIYFGGSRGPGKTSCQIAWMAAPCVELDEAGKVRYPKLRCLQVREQYEDLKDWVDKAWELYQKFGATKRDDPVEFHFPGGPIIYTGYMKGDKWTKFQGWNIHRLGVDEAGQIPDIRFMGETVWPVELLMASVRGSPTGRSQAFLTGNPGNVNDKRIKERYTRARDIKGRIIPPYTTIVDSTSGKTRVFIPGKPTDNPWLMENDPGYMARLRAMPEQVQRAWIDGDWDAFEGQFFTEWRPNGPQNQSEPPWARHVIPHQEIRLSPWWWRWASLDWGYGHFSAAYKFAQHPNGQVITYDEMVRQKTSSFRLGVEIAKWLMPDLAGLPEGNLLLYVSPDAIDHHRDEGHTIAENIQMGIQTVLGKGGAWIAAYTEEEKELRKKDPVAALDMMRRRQKEDQGRYSITICRANNARVSGWNYIRDLLRWTPIEKAKPDQEYIAALMKGHHAELLVKQYLSQFDETEEVLPGVVISERCHYLKEGIPLAIHDPNRIEDVMKQDGDDFIDAWRYGCMAHSDNRGAMPKAQYVSDRIALVEKGMIERGFSLEDPTLMAHAMMRIEREWEKEQDEPIRGFNLPRGGVSSPFSAGKPS